MSDQAPEKVFIVRIVLAEGTKPHLVLGRQIRTRKPDF